MQDRAPCHTTDTIWNLLKCLDMVILDMMMTGHHGVTHLILMVGVEEAGGGFTQGKINTALLCMVPYITISPLMTLNYLSPIFIFLKSSNDLLFQISSLHQTPWLLWTRSSMASSWISSDVWSPSSSCSSSLLWSRIQEQLCQSSITSSSRVCLGLQTYTEDQEFSSSSSASSLYSSSSSSLTSILSSWASSFSSS